MILTKRELIELSLSEYNAPEYIRRRAIRKLLRVPEHEFIENWKTRRNLHLEVIRKNTYIVN